MTLAQQTAIRDVLAEYYVAHGLPADGGASDPWFRVHIGAVTLRLPNPPARRRAVFFHDVNHLATGYNTTFSQGEMAIAGFEVGAGCGALLMVWFINLSMLALGLLARPRAVFAAFVRGRRSASIYHRSETPAALSTMSVDEVRTLLRLDVAPSAATIGDRISFAFWAVVGSVVLLLPIALLLALIGVFVHWTVRR